MMSTGLHRACRWGLAFLLTLAVGIMVHAWLIPRLVARYLRHELAARGFPDAKLRVGSVGVHHVHLAGVTLGPGLDLGDVELDAGWSLLWRDARTLTLRGAHLTRDAVERWAAASTPAAAPASSPRAALQRLPIEQLRLADCTLDVGATRLSISGSVALAGASPATQVRASTPMWQLGPLALRDVAISARTSGGDVRLCVDAVVDGLARVEGCAPIAGTDPLSARAFDVAWTATSHTRDEWTASGRSRLTWSATGVRVADSKLELSAPAVSIGGHRLEGVRATGSVGEVTATATAVQIGRSELDLVAASAKGRELRLGEVRAKVATPSARVAGGALRVERPQLALEAAAAATDRLVIRDVRATLANATAMTASPSALRIDQPTLDVRAATVTRDGLVLDDVRARVASAGALATTASATRIDAPEVDVRTSAIRGDQVDIDDVRLAIAAAGDVRASAEGVRTGRARVELTAKDAVIHKVQLGDVRLRGTVDGSAQVNAFAIAGLGQASRVAVRGQHATRLSKLTLPFALQARRTRDATKLVVSKPLVARAADAKLEVGDAPMHVREPVMSLRPAGTYAPSQLVAAVPTIPWRASSFTWRGLTFTRPSGTVSLMTPSDVQHVAWAGVAGREPIRLGKGWAALQELGGEQQVVAGEVRALGGVLTVARRRSTPREVVLDVRGLQLPRLLSAARTHVEATGVVDGVVVLAAEEEGCSLRRLSLWARGPGVLRVRDPKWRAEWVRAGQTKLSGRVHGALADFAYRSLTVMVQPPGAAPEVQFAVHGDGRLITQSLDLVVNLRGARAAVQKLARRASW